MASLTRQQQSVLSFIEGEFAAGRPCPSMREIAARFGFASKTAAVDHVQALVKKGVLAIDSGKARSLRLSQTGLPSPAAVFEITLLGAIPAGFPGDREQGVGECVPVTTHSIGFKPTKNTFARRVSGDSMFGKHICDGDIVVLEHGAVPRPGQVVAVSSQVLV